MTRAFPPGFLFGTATSATQIEGGGLDHDWQRFAEQPGRIADGGAPARACEHWERWRDDVELQGELGLGAHRMSIEWARVEPVEGRFDPAALHRYREEVARLLDFGITPMITLHHFTLPSWLSERGGLCSDAFPRLFERYAREVLRALGDLCRLWITVNEPNVVVTMGYLFGEWPPADTGRLDRAVLGHHRLLEAHTRVYRVIKEQLPLAHVGVAHHLRIFEPRHPSRRRDRGIARVMDGFFNRGFAGALTEGSFLPGVDRAMAIATGFDISEAKDTQDFWGVNYYGRDLVGVSRNRREAFLARTVPDGSEVNMLGWEVYPEGLLRVLRRWHGARPLPVFITENGIATRDDEQRCRFLVRHLEAVLDALDEGIDVRGYFHWSLLDNFEWAEGYAPRFGLVEVDYETQTRRPRESARLYARIASDGALADDVRARGRAA